MSRPADHGRAVSPVIGVVLLVGIVATLAGVSAYVFLGLAETSESPPSAVLDLEEGEGVEYAFDHGGGDDIVGDEIEIRGAADPEAPAGERYSTGEEFSFYPVQEEITVVWYGDGRSHTLASATVDRALPEPDEGCPWVDAETSGGTDPIKIDGIVVNCDVATDGVVEVQDGGTVVGETTSETKELDADDARLYGDVTVEKVLNLQNGRIAGDATSRTADVKLDNGTAEGTVSAEQVAELQSGSVVEGDVASDTKDAKVLDSTVDGSVTADGTVKLDDATVEGDVYADPGDFDCTDSTIGGRDCGEYTPKDPANW